MLPTNQSYKHFEIELNIYHIFSKLYIKNCIFWRTRQKNTDVKLLTNISVNRLLFVCAQTVDRYIGQRMFLCTTYKCTGTFVHKSSTKYLCTNSWQTFWSIQCSLHQPLLFNPLPCGVGILTDTLAYIYSTDIWLLRVSVIQGVAINRLAALLDPRMWAFLRQQPVW